MDHRIVEKKLQILASLACDVTLPIAGWQARTCEYLAPGEYSESTDWADVATPSYFPAAKTVFLKATVTVPDTLPIADTFFAFDFIEMDGMLRIDGATYAGIDGNHKRVPVPRHGTMELELEFISFPSVMWVPGDAWKQGAFLGGSLIVANREIEGLCYDARFAWETIKNITDSRRVPLLEAALEAGMLAVDLTLPRERLVAEVIDARQKLRDKVAAIAPDPEAGGIYAVGHTHIDTAWLWPLRETVRKCARTFSSACRLMERYPEFRFACSQAQLYQYVKDYSPDLYAEIKKWVATGRWETTGAMWIEADCNATSGESLIRQMLHGIAFFQREFGTRPRICWLPDVFGYPASLPEILKGCGVEYFYTYKLHWQATNPFPDHLFHWKGLDGSTLLAHVVNHVEGYNGLMKPEHLAVGWRRYAQKAEYPEVIFPYGHGDGGGGVSELMLEMLDRAKGHYPGLPAVRIGSAEGYFDDVVARNPILPTWDGELYVETHRGTYTSQSALKRANRKSELMLRDAEILGVMGGGYAVGDLDHAWKLVLLSQFHDILPGSSIPHVSTDAHRDHNVAQAAIRQAIDTRLAAVAPPTQPCAMFRLVNTLSWTRHDPMTAKISDIGDSVAVVSPEGNRRVGQVIERANGEATVLFEGAVVPSMGHADYTVETALSAKNEISVSEAQIETPGLLIALDSDGAITSIYDKRNHREILAEGTIANDLQLLQDGPEQEDAWNVHDTLDKRRYPIEGATGIAVIETGPVRGIVRVTRKHRESTFVQDIVVYASSNRIDFVNRVDWQERQTMLKVAFPLAIRSHHATYEVQFGALERPTHRNTSWDQQKFEVPAQRWADLSEPGYGVSLMNDCRYGYDCKENVLRLTLLRSTTNPDPLADKGSHEFTYSLLPHVGDWVAAETVRRAYELNAPVLSAPVSEATPPHSFISLAGAGVVVEAIKAAEDGGGVIIRLYEPHGSRGIVTVKLGFEVSSVTECDHVEQPQHEVAASRTQFSFYVKPFQIRTFRLRS